MPMGVQKKKSTTMADAKQGKPPVEDFCNGSPQTRVVLAKPRLGGFGSSSFGSSSSKSSNPFGSVLRPPQLKPGTNPFLKVTKIPDEDETTKEKETLSEETQKDVKEDGEVPMFVPLGANVPPRTVNTAPAPQPASSSSAGFVFGQNLSARVVMKENVNNGDASEDHSASNGTTELLFTSAVATTKEANQEDGSGSEASGSEGLAAAAAEYERSHARPPPPTTNCTITGEEGETNVLQISCRLFAWEAGSWRERGRGMLRLNDAAGGGGGGGDSTGAVGTAAGGARLVVRVAGSLRVVLNTKLWPDMVVEQAGTKSLRITAADQQNQVKLYLIMGAPGDIIQLTRALKSRVAVSKRTTPNACVQNDTSQRAAERLEAAADESDYLDKPDDDAEVQNGIESTVDDDTNEPEQMERLEADPEQKTEEHACNVDGMKEDKEPKTLKRKEPVEHETSPKRQCPEIVIE